MTRQDNHYDAILIGSGIGALTAASLLAQMENQRVLVLERHFKIGGFTHTFRRKGKYEWDVGVHYIGQMREGEMTRMVFDYVTGGQVDWCPMPDVYDKFVYPDFTFEAHSGGRNLKRDLIARFPQEEAAIEQYFRDVMKAASWLGRYATLQLLPRWMGSAWNRLAQIGAKMPLMTTGEYLDKHFKDPQLKAVLVSQWGDYGLPPAMSAFAIHAVVVAHYFKGGFYPLGSAKTIPQSVQQIVEARGGRCLVNHRVTEIIADRGRAIGVRAIHQKGDEQIECEFYAPNILSNAGAWITYTQLMPPEYEPHFRQQVEQFPVGGSHVNLYLGLKQSPHKLGFAGENHWIYAAYDHDAMYARRNRLAEGEVNSVYLSFPSLKDPHAKAHTAEIIAGMDYELFQQWANQPWKQRGEDYEQFKQQISDAMIDFVEARYPGFRDLIDYQELSTPLSTEKFTGHRRGNIYGLPAVPERYRMPWLSTRTPLKGLYLVGSDTASHGIVGAMMGSVLTTGLVLGGFGSLMRIFGAVRRYAASRSRDVVGREVLVS